MSPRHPANLPHDDPEATAPPLMVNDRWVGDARADQQQDAQGDPQGVGDTVTRWHRKTRT